MIKPAKLLISNLLLTIPLAFSTTGAALVTRVASTPTPACQVQYVYTLPPLLSGEVESVISPPTNQIRRLQIGARRALQPAIVLNSKAVPGSAWSTSPDGSASWSAALTSQAGLGIRVHLENVSLPAGAQILLSNPDRPGLAPLTITTADLGPLHEAWTETVFGDRVVITCRVARETDRATATFTVGEISHIYVMPAANSNLKEGDCHNDVSCSGDWANDAAAVARISFIEHGNTYLCTGCLLASTVPTSAQYFLTASHCVPNQTVASTIEFFWFYQTSSCGGAVPDLSAVPHTSGGADRLAGSTDSDFAFLRLKHPAPGGVSFLAWSLDPPSQGETLTCIHHPDGSFKRISFGHLYDSDADFWAVQWFSGVTEGGSSGSPLLNASHQVVGQLNGGFAGPGSSCDAPSDPDQFGRFDVIFNTIKRWLTSSSGGGTPGPGTDFTAVKGTYTGLFVDGSSGDPQHTSGLATITVSAKGKLSGKLTIGAQKVSMSGQFDSEGNAQITVRRQFSGPLSVALHVDLSGDSDQINGSISDGSFNAELIANLNIFNFANPAPQAGQYTIVLPGISDDSNAPDGSGYATVSVDRMGKIKLSGSLADGTKISQSSVVSRDGTWPFYVPLYAGGGSLLSWLNFSGADGVAGEVTWIRPGLNAAKYYPGGFTIQLAATGSRYTRPTGNGTILNFDQAQLSLTGGDLSQDVSDQFQLTAGNRIVNLGPAKLILTFSAANGSFSGKLSDPSTATTASFRGVVLQDRNFGTGYFLGASHSGQVFLGP
jgi:hypothetical protein